MIARHVYPPLSQQLVDEKRRALEELAPRVSLQEAIAGVPGGSAPLSMVPQQYLQPQAAVDSEAPTSLRAVGHDITDGEFASVEASVAESDGPSVSSAPSLHRSSEAAQLRAMRLQQELLVREAEECTFHPRTNRHRQPVRAVQSEAFFTTSQRWAEQVAIKKEARKQKLALERDAECTFSPQVTPRRHSARRTSAGGPSSHAPAAAAEAPPANGNNVPVGNPSVVSRLYQPTARMRLEQSLEEKREEQREQQEAECSFQPSINAPLRSNVATNVSSRYRQPSPAKPRPMPTGAEECTFSPAVNRTPRALSSAVSEYLDDPAYLRLSRAPASPRGPDGALTAAGGSYTGNPMGSASNHRSLTRSASAPRPSFDVPSSPGGEEVFNSFLERQQAHLQRKRVADAKRAEAAAEELENARTVGTASSRRKSGAHEADGGERGAGTPRRSSGASFLERVAEATKRRNERLSSVGDHTADLPSEHVEHCSFRPVITQSAHARRARTVNELSVGEAERRSRALETRKAASDAQSDEGHTFQPHINEVPGVHSRLKVTSEPGSYLARVRQHMKLKEQLTNCVREAQESQVSTSGTEQPPFRPL